jgi:hypothetical protein
MKWRRKAPTLCSGYHTLDQLEFSVLLSKENPKFEKNYFRVGTRPIGEYGQL